MEECIYEENNNLKLPENTGINWLENKINSGELNIKIKIADTCRYLSDFISVDEFAEWKPQVPVFISAQTGAGKNFFIKNVFLRKIIENARKDCGYVPNNLMLILSNRIALTRQTKASMANFLINAIGDCNYSIATKTLYTSAGVDEICIDFGIMTICSYHQMVKRNILETKYQYIICDEFHFFTSDATFNNETDKILKEIVDKGDNAIRIYMSATPEIAMPIVIMKEWQNSYKNFVKNVKMNLFTEQILNQKNLKKELKNVKKKKKIKKAVENFQSRKQDLEYVAEEELRNFCLNINFYHMRRNYNYIEKIYEYQKISQLVEAIDNSESKWLIFVKSEKEGMELKQALKTKNIECKMMSRKTVDNLKTINQEYDYLIEEETITTKVLIATSIIDNGINITNEGKNIKSNADKVLNIAVDTFDRTEFIQMLGRVRRTAGDKISLYIKHHSIADVKEMLLQNTKELLTRLQVDFNPYYNEDIFDSKVFRIENGQMRYNECAVWELVGRMMPQLLFLKNNSQYSLIKFPSERDEAMREQIYNYYKYNEHGREIQWSRNIVDLLDSEYDHKNRIQYIQEDIDNGLDVNRHEYKLSDTFENWQYRNLSEYYEDRLNEEYKFFIENLNDKEWNRFNYKLQKNQVENTSYAKLNCLSKNFNFCEKRLFLDMKKYTEMWNQSNLYYTLSDIQKGIGTTQEKLRWLEIPNAEVTPLQINSEEKEIPKTLEELVKRYSASVTEIEENYVNGSRDVKKEFLKNCGILKDSELAKQISEKFFNGFNLTNVVTDSSLIPLNLKYELKSYREQTTRKTYYIFNPKAS